MLGFFELNKKDKRKMKKKKQHQVSFPFGFTSPDARTQTLSLLSLFLQSSLLPLSLYLHIILQHEFVFRACL